MNHPRLGDLLDSASVATRAPAFPINDNLAKRIFDPQLEDAEIASHYLQSSPPRGAEGDPKIFEGLGD